MARRRPTARDAGHLQLHVVDDRPPIVMRVRRAVLPIAFGVLFVYIGWTKFDEHAMWVPIFSWMETGTAGTSGKGELLLFQMSDEQCQRAIEDLGGIAVRKDMFLVRSTRSGPSRSGRTARHSRTSCTRGRSAAEATARRVRTPCAARPPARTTPIDGGNGGGQVAPGKHLPEHGTRRLRHDDLRAVRTIGEDEPALEIHGREIVELWRALDVLGASIGDGVRTLDALGPRIGEGCFTRKAGAPAPDGPGPREDVGGPSARIDGPESENGGPGERIE
jgi:hypothetical protein